MVSAWLKTMDRKLPTGTTEYYGIWPTSSPWQPKSDIQEPSYDADITLRLAGEAIVTRVGEAVNRLSDGFKDLHPDIPWRNIRGARNLATHYGQRIDPQMIWLALERDLPEIGRRLGLVEPPSAS